MNLSYRAEIDGLRALAVLPVMLFHAGIEFFSGGFVGVDVFFVISGYLITSIIISELSQDKFNLVTFYERRARRILPALFLVMLASVPFAWMWLTPDELRDFGQSLIAVSMISSNVLFWTESGYFDTAAELKPLLHTWSLAVEEQYYVLFPLFLLLTWRLGKKWIVVCLMFVAIVSLALAQWSSINNPSAAFYLLPTRAWELLLGVFAAFYLTKQSKPLTMRSNQLISLLGIGMIIYAILFFHEDTPFPGLYALIPTLGTLFIILAAVPGTLAYKLLSWTPFVGIGLISYSAYLWHQPLLVFAKHRLLGDTSTGLMLTMCLLTLLLAYVSWRWIEQPFRDKKKTSRRFIFSFSAVGLTCFMIIGAFFHSQKTVHGEWSADVRRHQCLLQGDKETVHATSCYEDAEGILVWGDSHAASLSIGLRELADSKQLPFTQLTQSGCPPIFNLENLPHRKTCNEVNERIFEQVVTKGYSNIILHAAWIHHHYPLSEAELKAKFEQTIKQIKGQLPNAEIVVIGNSPRWQASPYQISRFVYNYIEQESLRYYAPLDVIDVDKIFKSLSQQQDFRYIPLIEQVCIESSDSQYCPMAKNNGDLFYIDWGHLSRTGSVFIVELISEQLFP